MPVSLLVIAVMGLSLAVVLPTVLLVQAGAEGFGDWIEAARPGDDRASRAKSWQRSMVPLRVSLGLVCRRGFRHPIGSG